MFFIFSVFFSLEERCEPSFPLYRNTGSHRFCPDINSWKDLDNYEIGDGYDIHQPAYNDERNKNHYRDRDQNRFRNRDRPYRTGYPPTTTTASAMDEERENDIHN